MSEEKVNPFLISKFNSLLSVYKNVLNDRDKFIFNTVANLISAKNVTGEETETEKKFKEKFKDDYLRIVDRLLQEDKKNPKGFFSKVQSEMKKKGARPPKLLTFQREPLPVQKKPTRPPIMGQKRFPIAPKVKVKGAAPKKKPVKLPINPWVFFVKELSKQTGESYGCLLGKQSTKEAYAQYKRTLGDFF